MAFPAGLTLVTVHGRFDMLPNGGATGSIDFVARYPLVGAADDSIVPPFTAMGVLDASGEFTVDLPATNDPGWTPQGWAYAVRATAGGATIRGTLQLDYQSTEVELADLLQVDGTAETGVSYLLLGQRGVAGGVAALDADGDVTDASGSKITGGGGGDGSDITASQITDSTATGRAVLTAASQAAARTAIGAGTSSLALGTSGTTAAAGNDSRLSDARTPTVHASTHADGGSDEIAIDASQITTGSVAIARLPTGSSSSTVVVGNDSRLSDARTPTAHASSHASAGADPVSLNASQITAGTLATTQGGTGLGSFTSGNFVSASSTSALATTKAVPVGAVVGTTDTQTLTNKTLTAPAISSPTGLAKGDVGLGSVTNAAQVPLSTVTTKGDLVAATGSAAVARLAAGSNGTFLVADSSQTAGLKWFASAPVLVLGPVDSIPGGTPAGTVIVRTTT